MEEIFIKKVVPKQITKIVKKTTPTLEERGITPKDVMQTAQKADDDEFYTRYEDIEKEIEMYDKRIWKDKVVFCNCDDAVGNDERNTSAFALYFLRNFDKLKLKMLICTHYGDGLDIFHQGGKGYVFTRDGFSDIEDYEKLKVYPNKYTGSFDDPLSLKILNEEADIVCTNPPFSKAREYWKILIESKKKFLIISNFTNVKNQPYISYFRQGKVRPGYNRVDWFLTPKRQITDAPGHWYTNFLVKNRPKYKLLNIIPLKKIPEKYKIYDDSKTLIVNNNYIPSDYNKPFGVSVYPIVSGILEKVYKIVKEKQYRPYINDREVFARVLIQKIEN